ncbi:MAG: 2Fe-2S iron-sulfur cluster-binding protein [Gammaproteobacteria bacterium]
MPTMTIRPLNQSVAANQGATILQALMAAGVDMPHKCGGKAECGTCHIFVHEGRKGLSKVQRLENEKLDSIVGVGSKSRLACQVVIGTEDFAIELLGFSSGV